MRTTLDIDDDVLEAAKELAAREKTTAGRVVSDLARAGLVGSSGTKSDAFELIDDIPLLPSRGVVVTREIVARLIEETDLAEGRASLGK